MNKSLIAGIVIFVVIVLAGSYLYFFDGGMGQSTVVTGYVGGEKIPYLKDEEVIKILKKSYGIDINYIKAGSIEMAREDVSSMDFIFPSSQIALEIFKSENQTDMVGNEIIFNSPIVLYSWNQVAEALVKEGIATNIEGIYYSIDMEKLIEYIKEQKSWEDINVNLYGKMKIICTDPLKSNSGNMYLGLLINTLAGDIATEDDIPLIKDDITTIFNDLGYMESSSGTLFDRYLVRGMGDSPIIVGYESQMIDFAINNPEKWAGISDEVAIFYPQPTVWSEHPLIAITTEGKDLMHALQDEKLQMIAVERFGFRSLYSNKAIYNFPEGIKMIDILDQVMPMPKAQVMTEVMDILEGD